MMPLFIHDDFLLTTEMARRLYHETADGAPVYDFHNHLDVRRLVENSHYPNLTALWIANDPYKHRAMRIAGVHEKDITGDASDRQKFSQWAATVPHMLGNPLYEWSALELARAFGIRELLSPSNEQDVWERCNHLLQQPSHSARQLLGSTGCRVLCTSDTLLDDLDGHAALARSGYAVKVLPSLRGDDLLNIAGPYGQEALRGLSAKSGVRIGTLDDWKQAVSSRLDVFTSAGCKLADHGLDSFAYATASEDVTAALFQRALSGSLVAQEQVLLHSGLLHWLGTEYHRRGWALQLHMGAQRATSTRLLQRVGKAGGFATIGNSVSIPQLCQFLDDLEQAGALPKMILYPLNPADYAPVATLTGSFPGDGVRGNVQLGPAWWYNDHAYGMRQQLDCLSSYGLLSTFVGMTTDSRSPLSMYRHEYFRRVLCDWMGSKVASGEFPSDEAWLASYVRGICGENVRAWLNLEERL